MHKIGLKLWSTNTDYYLAEAKRLYEQGVYSYIELYVVPGTLDKLPLWRALSVPYIIHCPHFAHGFNLAKADHRESNKRIYAEVKQYADALHAQYVIFHGGIDGTAEETAHQLVALQESRALLENKPYAALPNRMGGQFCRGATHAELKEIIEVADCGFCLDIGHAVCSANSQGKEPYSFVQELLSLNPAMFHLSDVEDMTSPYDAHPHLGTGELDLHRVLQLLPERSLISLETIKSSTSNLNDFVEDVLCIRPNQVCLTAMSDLKVRNTFFWVQDLQLRKLFMLRGEPTWETHVSYYKKVLADISQKVYAIEVGGIHIGNCGLKHLTKCSAELWIYIGYSQFKNKGYGTQACRELLRVAQKMGLSFLYLHVLKINTSAIKLYHRLGFQETRLSDDDMMTWGERASDVIKMEVRLNG